MANVKVFQKKDKLEGQGHKVKNYGTGTMWKALSCEIWRSYHLLYYR